MTVIARLMTDAQAVGSEGPWAVIDGTTFDACSERRFTYRRERAGRFPDAYTAKVVLGRQARPLPEKATWRLLDDEENEVREMDVNYYEIQEVGS